MSSLDKTCEDVIRKVTTSNLDFKIKQTPYSIFFSIRKKFTKNVTKQDSAPPIYIYDEQSLSEKLQHELLLTRLIYYYVTANLKKIWGRLHFLFF